MLFRSGRIPCRLLCAGHSYAEGVPAILLFLKLKAMLPEIYAGCAERGNPDMTIFHYTIKRVGRSKGKSVISASAYLNEDVMKNEETGRISYYTSKKEVVYTSLMMCENAPPEWQIVPEENIKRFQKSEIGRASCRERV